MDIRIDDVTSVQKKAFVRYPKEDVESELKSAYKDFRKNFIMKGFRPGRVPLFILKSRFGKQIEREVGSKMVNDAIIKMYEDYKIRPLFEPEPEEWKLDPEKEFTFTLVFEVRPQIDPVDFTGIETEIEPLPPFEEDLDNAIMNIKEKFSRLVPTEGAREAREGDYIIFDLYIKDKKTDKILERSEGVQSLLDVKSLKYELFNDIIGMKKGEDKLIERTFPEDYDDELLKGRETLISIKLQEIKIKVYPELNDDFAKQVGEFETLEEMISSIRREIQKSRDEEVRERVRNAVIKVLIERNPFEIPEMTIKRITENRIRSLKSNISKGKGEDGVPSYEPSEEEIRRITEKVEFDFRKEVLLEAIAKKENIEVSEEDMNRYFTELASSIKSPVEAIKGRLLKERGEEEIKRLVLQDKTLAFIVKGANIKMDKDQCAADDGEIGKKEVKEETEGKESEEKKD